MKKKDGSSMKDLPIGYIDSGFGGLTVVRQSLKQIPNESVIFIGDSARCPYGPRTPEEVKAYTWQLTQFLLNKGIKMLVIACNTATAAALSEIRAAIDIPVVGVVHPGSRAAVKQTDSRHIAVIGTEGTINSKLYENVMLEKDNTLTITSIACPEFVPIVESDRRDTDATRKIVAKRLAPLKTKNIDTLILGCTHYPLLSHKIQDFMGPDVYLIDSGKETVNEVSTLLDYYNLSRTADDAKVTPPTHDFYTTGALTPFYEFVVKTLNMENIHVEHCQIKGDEIVEVSHSESK